MGTPGKDGIVRRLVREQWPEDPSPQDIESGSGRPQQWSEFLSRVTLFDNAVRLRFLVWTLQRYVPRGARVLEVGCGSGTMAVLMADLGFRVTASDIDPELIDRFESKYSRWFDTDQLTVRKVDMFYLPWAEKHFDLVYHQGVLEHFTDDRIVAALREQARVARFVLFDVPNHRYQAQPFGDERLLRIGQWRRLIRAAGLEIIDERGRDFHHWLYILPHAFFSHRALDTMPWFVRWFAVTSIFVCRSPL
jgi:SAM-dependent methyltransferase